MGAPASAEPAAPPSLSVAVARDGEVVLAEAVGLADPAGPTPATAATTYRVYSVSKAITAIAVMHLVERGELALDDDIRGSVPALPVRHTPIRLEHLLTHTSGIRHYREGAGEISSQIEYATLADSLAVFAADPLEFEPGTDYLYSSFGFNLLTGAVEHASGRSFARYLRPDVFDPAGMESAHLAVAGRVDPRLAAPHDPGRRASRAVPNVSGRYGSSGVVATPTDLVRLCLALGDGTLLSDDAREALLAAAVPALSEQQALGWRVTEDEAGRRLAYAAGGGIGYTALLFWCPDEGVAAALATNQAEFDERVAVLEALVAPFLEH